jgi:stress response protein SCP2
MASFSSNGGNVNPDFDASAVIFSNTGKVLNAVFYNQTSCFDGALQHSGDERTGIKEGPKNK